MNRFILAAAAFAAVIGCSSNGSKPWPDLHPAKGSITVDGQTPSGGYVSLHGDDPSVADVIVSGRVEADGKFTLNTVHATEKNSPTKAGAPAGTFKVRFMPPANGDQATGTSVDPIDGKSPVTIKPGDNELKIELNKPRKK